MPKKVIVVIGGGDSGKAAVRAALRAPERPHVLLVERGSSEGVEGVRVIPNSEAVEVAHEDRSVRIKSKYGPDLLKYDALIIATGSQAIIPEHLMMEGVFTAKSVSPTSISAAKHVTFYGLGICGLAILAKIGNRDIIVVEPEEEILSGTLDPPLASRIRNFLFYKGVKFFLGERIERVYGYGKISGIETETGFKSTDILIVDLGMVPRGKILSGIIKLGPHGGIPTNAFQGVGVEGIYACGSCAEVNDASIELRRPIPTLDVSHTSGMVAGYNAAGLKIATHGYVRKVRLNLYGLEMISIGATEMEAKKYGIPHYTIEADFKEAIVKVILEKDTERLLGVQGLGPGSSAMLEWIALAIKGRMTAHDLLAHHFDLSTPSSIALHLALDEAIK